MCCKIREDKRGEGERQGQTDSLRTDVFKAVWLNTAASVGRVLPQI